MNQGKKFIKKRNRKGRSKNQKAFALYPRIPSVMRVSTRSRTYETGSSTASPLYFQYGLVEFLGKPGQYSDSLFGLYKYAVIHGVRINLKVVNMGSEPLIFAVAPLPFSWVGSTPTLAEILDAPRCVRTTVGGSTGMDKAEISNAITAKALLGSDVAALRYQQDQARAGSTTPLFPDEPCWTVVLSAFNALNTVSFRVEVELTYNVEYFNLDSA